MSGMERLPAEVGMTPHVPATAASAIDPARRTAWARSTAAVVAVGGGAFLVALVLRLLFLDRAYDIFADEVTYLLLAKAVASGQGILLHGAPFFLHPPLFFVIEGAVAAATGLHGSLIEQVLAIRTLNAVLGAATATTIMAIAWRTAGPRIALVAFTLFAIDPFIIRLNSRNLLETSALLWVLLGYLALTWRSEGGRLAPRGRQVVAAGLLFGMAALTKDMTALLTVAPMLLLTVTGRLLPRLRALAVAVIAAATYAVYPVLVVLGGLGPAFAEQKLHGLLRFIGVAKTTGFVASGGPSFLGAVTRNLDTFVSTYGLIALGIPACLLLLALGDGRRRLLGLLALCSLGSLTYSIAFGTLEEQFFYFLVAPAILCVPIAWAMLVPEVSSARPGAVAGERAAAGDGTPAMGDGTPAPGDVAMSGGEMRAAAGAGVRGAGDRRHAASGRRGAAGWWRGAVDVWSGVRGGGFRLPLPVRTAAGVMLGISLAWSGLVWVEVHTQRDDGYAQLEAYLRAKVPNGSRLGVTTDPQQFLLQGYVINIVASAADVRSTRSRYVALSTKQIEEGYTRNGPAFYSWIRGHARPLWVFDGRSYGRIELYRIAGE